MPQLADMVEAPPRLADQVEAPPSLAEEVTAPDQLPENPQPRVLVKAAYNDPNAVTSYQMDSEDVPHSVDNSTPAIYRPLYDQATEQMLADWKAGKKPIDWSKLDGAGVLGMAGLLMQAYPDDAAKISEEARPYAKAILTARGFPDEDASTLAGTTRRFEDFAGAAGGSALTDLAQKADQLATGATPQEADEAMANASMLARQNRALSALQNDGDTNWLKTAGVLLSWAAGANAVARGQLGLRTMAALDASGAPVLTEAGTPLMVRAPFQYAVDPLSLQGILRNAGFSAAYAGAQGPEYVPSMLAQTFGLPQDRVKSALEAGGLDLVFGTILRGLHGGSQLDQWRKAPAFSDLADLNDKDFQAAATKRVQGALADELERRAAAARPPGAAPADAPKLADLAEAPEEATTPAEAPAPAAGDAEAQFLAKAAPPPTEPPPTGGEADVNQFYDLESITDPEGFAKRQDVQKLLGDYGLTEDEVARTTADRRAELLKLAPDEVKQLYAAQRETDAQEALARQARSDAARAEWEQQQAAQAQLRKTAGLRAAAEARAAQADAAASQAAKEEAWQQQQDARAQASEPFHAIPEEEISDRMEYLQSTEPEHLDDAALQWGANHGLDWAAQALRERTLQDPIVRAQMQQEHDAAEQESGAVDLLTALRRAGRKLPSPQLARAQGDPMAGELQDLSDSLTFGQRQQIFDYNRYTDPDRVRESLTEEGFRYETPAELLADAIDNARGFARTQAAPMLMREAAAPLDETAERGNIGSDERPTQQELALGAQAVETLGHGANGPTETRIVPATGHGIHLSEGEPARPGAHLGGPGWRDALPSSIKWKGYGLARRLIGDGVITFTGEPIHGWDDLAARAQVLRNPLFETFYALFFKDDTLAGVYAVSSREPSITRTLAPGDTPATLKAMKAKLGANGYAFLHNHPTGDVRPSPTDVETSEWLAEEMGDGYRGHIVINHTKYAIIFPKEDAEIAIEVRALPGARGRDPLRQPEIKHPALGQVMAFPDQIAQAGKAMESGGDTVTAFLLNKRKVINAVVQLAVDDLTRPGTFIDLGMALRESGAPGAALYYAGPRGAEVKQAAHDLMQRGYVHDYAIKNADGTMDFPGHEESQKAEERRNRQAAETTSLRVQEDEDPGQLGEYQANAPYRVEVSDQKWAPLELGHLEKVRPVEMPELVQMIRALTGDLPELRKLPKADGLFRVSPAGTARVVLDPRIFTNAVDASRTAAHELGHLVDWFPSEADQGKGTLSRGNILGHLAALRGYLKNTLEAMPSDEAKRLTPEDRKFLRNAAMKKAGPRPPGRQPEFLKSWQDRAAAIYRSLLEQAAEKRGLLQREAVTEELKTITEWWRPFEPENVPASYLKYRYSAKELYADALSVLFNSPQDLAQKAPKFWKSFFAYLDKRPQAKAQLFETWELLNRGQRAVLAERERMIRGMFASGEELFMRKFEERRLRHNSLAGWKSRLKQEFWDHYAPVIDRARQKYGHELDQVGQPAKFYDDPRWIFDAHPLAAGNREYIFSSRLFHRIVRPLERSGLTTQQLGEFMLHNRILNEAYADQAGNAGGRANLANPLGLTPLQARQHLLKLRLDLGMEKMTALERAARDFQDLTFAATREAVDVGSYHRETFAKIVEPNRRNYATFAVLDGLENNPHIPAGIRAQTGTLKDIANPFTAQVLKTITLLRLNELQRAKNAMLDGLAANFPGDFARAEVTRDATGRATPRPPPDGREQLMRLVDGQPEYWNTDPYIARAFERLVPAQASAALQALNLPWQKIFYPLAIKYNPAFMLWTALYRHYIQSARNLGAVTQGRAGFWKLAGAYLRNYQAAAAYADGKALETAGAGIVNDMMHNQAIGTPLDTQIYTDARNDHLEQLLERARVLPERKSPWQEHNLFRTLTWLPRQIARQGSILAVLPKVGAYDVLTNELGMPRGLAANVVRNYIGIPNTRKKGTYTNIAAVIQPFLNVAMKGYAADAALATHPKTAAGWWYRYAMSDGLMQILLALAAAGVFGKALEEMSQGIGGRDKMNYAALPLGTTEGGEYGHKTTELRLPMDPSAKAISGLLYWTTYKAAMTAQGRASAATPLPNALNFLTEQLPGENPTLKIAQAWKQYLGGQNPIDDYRGQPILTDNEFLAGGWDSLKPMLAWTADEGGASSFFRYDPRANTTTETVVGGAPVLSSILKFTDQGYREQQQAQQLADESAHARAVLDLPAGVQALIHEYEYLDRVKAADRTPAQQERFAELAAWHHALYDRSGGGPSLMQHYVQAHSSGDTTAAQEQAQNLAAFSAGYFPQSAH
ncbi:MAG TPA: hypothetical protein VHC95_07150 [Opitutales bacterium]|nr:hypothetical protein [Opitutales bacterium]